MANFADIIINRKSPALDRIFTYNVPPHLHNDLAVGMLVTVPFNHLKLEGVVIRLHDQRPDTFDTKDVVDIISEQPLFNQELLDLSSWMADYYHCSRVVAMQAMLPSGMSLSGKKTKTAYYVCYSLATGYEKIRCSAKRKELIELLSQLGEVDAASLKEKGFNQSFLLAAEKAGLVQKESRRIFETAEIYPAQPIKFNPEQQAVYDAINRERKTRNRPYLLHGVTGSGKTEIYLRLIDEAAQRGEQSIILVPEIALSSQMVDMLSRRLKLPMALLHSGLRQSERRCIWQDIAKGRITVIVGARSAVFAPTPQLGLIIVDEAHENSYKQENNPRFHAVTVALKRTELCGAQLILGSATPAVESYYKAKTGRYALGELKKQYYSAPKAQVSIVDMREELRAGHKLIFSRELIWALEDTLNSGNQAVLFLNRRGYYTFFSCRDCGESIRCPHCAVALSYHEDRRGGKLKCHYCGHTIAPPTFCPHCGSSHIRHFGVGTQRVVDEAARLFPEARIARLDSDVMTDRGGYQRIYQDMLSRHIDILVGTQMVVKGLDFPHLHLSAVIAADSQLNLPDWRAGERTFQLISQLIGRAGRRKKQGKAIIQTYMPDALPIRAAANHDYEGFYQAELLARQMHGYPPFTHLLRVLFTSADQGDLLNVTENYAYYLKTELGCTGEICGPADAPYPKIKDRWRRQVIIKAGDVRLAAASAQRAWDITRGEERLPRDIMFSMDIDPMSIV